jgi:hypothetical protein
MKSLAESMTQARMKKWKPSVRGNAVALVIAIAIGIVACCISVRAQSGAGSIQGTVTDSTGAVIQGASIHVVQQGTNVASDTTSSSVGFYQVPELFTGTYDVTVAAPGMKSYKTTIDLLVAQNAVINPTLTAGAVTQQVSVSANTVQLTTTDNGTITSTLENSRINQLPMNGRLLLTLIGETTPGLEDSGTRANGLMGEALEYVEDGAPSVVREFGGANVSSVSTQVLLPDPDAVQEVRIETTDTGAQYATPGTAVLTSKSGSNSLHGSLFETARNNAFGIARDRQDPANYAAPHYVRNEYGASAGGPIVLPHIYHGKDRSFWFFAFEKYSLASFSPSLEHVPTAAMEGGNFSGLINSSGVLQTLYDPATTTSSANCNGSGTANQYCRQTFTQEFGETGSNINSIPAGRLSPATKVLYALTPPTTSSDDPLVASNVTLPSIADYEIPNITFRLDHVFNDTNRAYLRYTNVNQTWKSGFSQPGVTADGIPAGSVGNQGFFPAANFTGAIGYTHVFSPTFFAETVLSQDWLTRKDYFVGDTEDYEQTLGVPNNFGELGFPGISGTLWAQPGNMGRYGMTQIISNIDENMTKTVGRHQMQFGGRYRHERFGYLTVHLQDTITFNGADTALVNPASGANYTATSNTGQANGDFFLGGASNYEVNFPTPYTHYHDMEFDGYFQDNFHVSRNLTANIGLRYENHPAIWTKYGLDESWDLKNNAMVLASPPATLIAEGYTTQAIITNLEDDGVTIETPAQAGMPANTLLRNYPFNFSPRVGLAYLPFNGKYGTVIRGAYGRYIYPVPIRSSVLDVVQDNEPYLATYNESYINAAQAPDGLPNYLMRAPQAVVMGANSANVVNTSTTNAILPGFESFALNPSYPPDFVTQVNATIEQPLKGNSVLRVSWLWSHGTNLDQEYQYNLKPSQYVYEMQKGTLEPTGGTSAIGTSQYATTGADPYNQVSIGSGSIYDQKSGWSNDNALQVNYQRLFHHGIAYQVIYVWSKPFRVGGNFFRDTLVDTAQDYANSGVSTMTQAYGPVTSPILPPAPPPGTASYGFWHNLDVYENHYIDTAIPKQHISFNGIIDLPVGRGKRFLGNSNRFMNEVVGGFQLAGDGSILSQDFQVANGNWGPTNPIKVYKHNAKITDCRSGVCHESFEWFNGYLAPTVIPSNSGNAKCTLAAGLVTGLPANWAPYESPIDTDCNPSDAAYKYYGDNEVNITLPGGTPTAIAFSPGPQGTNPYSRTFLNGPMNYTIDLSLFKVFPITERTNLRFNIDAFNALNVQGYSNPNTTDGTESLLSSYNTPRQVQFTLRLQF